MRNIYYSILVIILLISPAVNATNTASVTPARWVKDGAIGGSGDILYLSSDFSHKTGKFSATPESMLDKKESEEGTFLLGTYRIVSSMPAKDINGIQYDELIATEIIDCDNYYFGRVRTVEKLKGKIVRDEVTPDAQISMDQTHLETADSKLCQLHAGVAPTPLENH